MSDRLPARSEGTWSPVAGPPPASVAPPASSAPLHERMLAYGAITVMISEDMDVSGFGPNRYRVAIGGQPVNVLQAHFDKGTGRRVLDTPLGIIVIPGAQERARGAQVTVGGLAVPGA